MERLDIDDEDSLSDRLEQTHKGAGLDVAVIRLCLLYTSRCV